jgi:endogenous inhibitor of DNA gyrase (YacG/DUF329 family)
MSRAVCPICKTRPVDPVFRPFCSKRCADVDLQRWFTGRYAIPVVDDDQDPTRLPDDEG